MKVLFIGVYKDGTGWGNAAQNYILALDAAGVEVVPRAIKLNDYAAEIPERILELEDNDIKNCDIVIQNVLPHHMDYSGNFKKNIGIYFTETNHFRNSSWPQRLNLMDELWVCNDQMVEAAKNSHITTPTKVVPIPTDISKYDRQYDVVDIDSSLRHDFVFYFIGEIIRRKNVVSLIKAFHLEFGVNEPVSLVIKGNLAGETPVETANHITEMCNQIKANLKIYPSLGDYKEEVVVTDMLNNESILRMHQTFDCFVAPSFGEAWCIPAFDAMAMGNTPIVNDVGGLSSFVDNDNGWLIPNSPEPVFGMTRGFSDLYQGNELWWNISIPHLQTAMREAYENSDMRRKKKQSCMEKVKKFSHENVGQLMKELLHA